MKFGELLIQNFLSIGEAKINLADRGLVLVSGQNDLDSSASSNGAGKSTIADALTWCLFGTTARGESGDDIVNGTIGKDCYVEVRIFDGADEYHVTRYRKHALGKNSLSLKTPLAMLTKGTDKLTQIEVERILGCTFDVFCASIVAGQDNMPDLPGMTDRNLKSLVEEAAGTKILERSYEVARERLIKSGKNADTADFQAREAEANLKARKDTLAQREHEHFVWNDSNEKSLVLHGIARTAKLKQVQDQVDVISSIDEGGLRAQIKALDDSIDAVSGEQAQERKLTAALSAAASKISAMRAKAVSVKENYERMTKAFKEVDHKIGCPCDDCGRPLTAAEIAPSKASILTKAKALRAEYDALKASVESATDEHKTLTDSLETFRASMTDTTKAQALREPLYRGLNALTDEKNHLRVRKLELAQIDSDIAKIKSAKSPYAASIEIVKKEILSAELSVVDTKESLSATTKLHAVNEFASKVFSPTGVRGQILDEVTPYLNDKTAIYLATLSDGNIKANWTTLIPNAKGELREKFGITVESGTGGKSFGLLSGGEKRKVRIAAALALQDLVSTRATKQIELFIGDEIDNALDPAGVERLMTILEEKARERGTVFIISHSDLKDWVSQQLTVIKDASGVSRIEEITS